MKLQEKINIIFNDVYLRGHGKKITVQRIIDVFGYDRDEAEGIFETFKKTLDSI